MKRLLTIAGIIILGVLAITLFSTCDIDSPFIQEIQGKIDSDLETDPVFMIIYNDNGADSGDVPVDSSSYKEGAIVTVLGNTGSLVKAGYTFVGWNTVEDGIGTNYQGDVTFVMGAESVILYAEWVNITYTISGKVTDHVTGIGVPGAKVGFGSNIATTNANGDYSVTVAENEEISGNFYFCKGAEYNFSVISGFNLTPVSDLVYNIEMDPVSTGGYPTHEVSGLIYKEGGSTQIANGSNVYITIINEDGGISEYSNNYITDTGYLIDTQTFGTNCILFIEVGNPEPFNYYIDNVDLSAENTTLNLTQPPSTGYYQVSVTGIDGTGVMGIMEYSNSVSFTQVNTYLSGTTNIDVQIYNPDSKSFYWSTLVYQDGFPEIDDYTYNMKLSTPSVPGSAVTLPVPLLAAPAQAVQGSSIAYSAGTLSFAGSADMFQIFLNPVENGLNGDIITMTIPVDIPSDIAVILESSIDSYTNWSAEIMSINISSFSDLDFYLSTMHDSYPPPELDYAAVGGDNSVRTNLIP